MNFEVHSAIQWSTSILRFKKEFLNKVPVIRRHAEDFCGFSKFFMDAAKFRTTKTLL